MLQLLQTTDEPGDRPGAYQRVQSFYTSLFRYKDPNQNGLKYWREKIVFSVLAAGAGLSLMALVPTLRMVVTEKLWALLVVDLLAVLATGTLLFSRRVSLEARTVAVLLMTFMIGVMVIWQVGFVSGGTAWLFCFAVLSGVLMGLRVAIFAILINAVAMITLGYLAKIGLIGDPGVEVSNARAVTAIANFLFLNAICAVSIAVLVNGLQSLNMRANTATRSLKKEHRKLLAAEDSLIQEIVERKESEKAARESEQKYRLLAANLRDVIWTMDLNFNFTYVSPAVVQIQGWTPEEFLNLTLEETLTPASFEEVVNIYTKQYEVSQQSGDYSQSVVLEVEMLTKSGGTVWTEVTANFLIDSNDAPIGVLGLTRDITERRQAQQEKEELVESLNRSRKMEALGTLAGGVAHDLNNVLSGIVSYPDLLLMDLPADSQLREPIETMRTSGQKATAIVQDLLTLARRGVTVTEPVGLNELIKDYLASPEFEKLQSFHPLVLVDTALAPGLLNAIGSPVHLSKTVMNLVSNAAEAMPDGGSLNILTENRHLERDYRGYSRIPAGDYVVVEVSDTGVGISPENINRIFEPFYTKKKMGRSGTGLGMAVVWGTVQDHNGFIDIDSVEDRGTRIALYLPVTEEVRSEKAEPRAIETYQGGGESVLIIDDVREQREVAGKILKQLGYNPVSASSGEEAVAYMENNSVDLLLLDMIMDPGIDGLETYKQIIEFHPNQRALITSGYAETDRVKEACRIGVYGYLKKPYTVQNLGVSIQQVLSG